MCPKCVRTELVVSHMPVVWQLEMGRILRNLRILRGDGNGRIGVFFGEKVGGNLT